VVQRNTPYILEFFLENYTPYIQERRECFRRSYQAQRNNVIETAAYKIIWTGEVHKMHNQVGRLPLDEVISDCNAYDMIIKK
jgi:hypothetical protein